MGGVLIQLIPLGLVGAIMPTRITIAILMLTSTKPLRNGVAYLAGLSCICIIAGLLMMILISGFQGAAYKNLMIAATIQVFAGFLFLILGVRSLLDTPDPDAPPARWIQHIQTISPGAAFVVGLILAFGLKLLMILLSAVTMIVNANIAGWQRIVALLILVALILLGVIIPVGLYASSPEHASAWLGRLMLWLKAHSRAVTVALSFALGAIFLFNGVAALG